MDEARRFSVVHHSFHHYFPAVDHTKVVKELFEADLLNVQKLHEGDVVKIKRDDIDTTIAWVIVTAVWKESLRNNFLYPICGRLCDGAYGHHAFRRGREDGRRLWAIGGNRLVFFDVYGWLGGVDGFEHSYAWGVIAAILGFVHVVLHHCNYRRIGNLTDRFIHEVLSDTLWAARKKQWAWSIDTFVEVRCAKKSIRHSTA